MRGDSLTPLLILGAAGAVVYLIYRKKNSPAAVQQIGKAIGAQVNVLADKITSNALNAESIRFFQAQDPAGMTTVASPEPGTVKPPAASPAAAAAAVAPSDPGFWSDFFGSIEAALEAGLPTGAL